MSGVSLGALSCVCCGVTGCGKAGLWRCCMSRRRSTLVRAEYVVLLRSLSSVPYRSVSGAPASLKSTGAQRIGFQEQVQHQNAKITRYRDQQLAYRAQHEQQLDQRPGTLALLQLFGCNTKGQSKRRGSCGPHMFRLKGLVIHFTPLRMQEGRKKG